MYCTKSSSVLYKHQSAVVAPSGHSIPPALPAATTEPPLCASGCPLASSGSPSSMELAIVVAAVGIMMAASVQVLWVLLL
jgi:hypothetical protein